jgi:hypothetical protein
MKCVALALAIGLTVPSVSWAATVEVLSGTVSINQGKGYQKITGVFQVNPGDRILVDSAGQANLVYSDGCFIKIGEPQKRASIVVPEVASCAAGNIPATAVVTGIVVAGGIAGAVLLATNSSDNKPASP